MAEVKKRQKFPSFINPTEMDFLGVGQLEHMQERQKAWEANLSLSDEIKWRGLQGKALEEMDKAERAFLMGAAMDITWPLMTIATELSPAFAAAMKAEMLKSPQAFNLGRGAGIALSPLQNLLGGVVGKIVIKVFNFTIGRFIFRGTPEVSAKLSKSILGRQKLDKAGLPLFKETVARGTRSQAAGILGKGAREVTEMGVAGAGVMSVFEATNVDKWKQDLEDADGDWGKALVARSLGTLEGMAVGALANATIGASLQALSLPFRLRAERTDKIRQQYAKEGSRLLRTPGQGQEALAEFINVPTPTNQGYQNSFGEELSTTLQDLFRTGKLDIGNREDLINQLSTRFGNKGNFISQKLRQRKNLFRNPDANRPITQAEWAEIKDSTVDLIASAKNANLQHGVQLEKYFQEEILDKILLKKEATETVSKILIPQGQIPSRFQLHKTKANNFVVKEPEVLPSVAELSKKLQRINKEQRRFLVPGEAPKFGEDKIAQEIGRTLLNKIDDFTGGAYKPIQKHIRMSKIVDDSLNRGRLSGQKGTGFFGGFRPTRMIEQAISDLAVIAGVSRREISDAIGRSSFSKLSNEKLFREIRRTEKIRSSVKEARTGLKGIFDFPAEAVEKGADFLKKGSAASGVRKVLTDAAIPTVPIVIGKLEQIRDIETPKSILEDLEDQDFIDNLEDGEDEIIPPQEESENEDESFLDSLEREPQATRGPQSEPDERISDADLREIDFQMERFNEEGRTNLATIPTEKEADLREKDILEDESARGTAIDTLLKEATK